MTSDIKEWSIFAIRNLMEDNTENQALISQLRMQGVSNTEELEELGIKLSISEGGAVKFVNK
eukprot:gene20363-24431_t